MNFLQYTVFIASLAFLAVDAKAQVYKCTADGKTTYQAAPCVGGKALALPKHTPTAYRPSLVDQARALDARRAKQAKLEAEQTAARDKAEAEATKQQKQDAFTERQTVAAERQAAAQEHLAGTADTIVDQNSNRRYQTRDFCRYASNHKHAACSK